MQELRLSGRWGRLTESTKVGQRSDALLAQALPTCTSSTKRKQSLCRLAYVPGACNNRSFPELRTIRHSPIYGVGVWLTWFATSIMTHTLDLVARYAGSLLMFVIATQKSDHCITTISNR